jgi:cytochrome c5
MELPEQGSEGERLYAAKCALCHPAFHPKTLSAREWEAIVKRMEEKVVTAAVREPLSDPERALILDYLKKHSRERII